MSTPNTPDSPTTMAQRLRSRWWRMRPRGRGAVVGAALVALLIVGAVATALATPGHPGRGGRGPDMGLTAGSGELPGRGGDDGLEEMDGVDDPGRGERGRGAGARGRGGALDRGLGDDTLLAGIVVSTADGSVVVAPDGGPQRTIRTDDRTRVRGNGNAALGDLQPGERVVVRVSGTGDAATAVTIQAPQARVTGTVTASTGDTATVTAIDGLTVTVNVAALSQRPAVGDLIVLTGEATDGTTITADGIRILPKAS